jgi:hypothetical protein
MLTELNRFERAQGEALYDFVAWLKVKNIVNDEHILEFIDEFTRKYDLDGASQDLTLSVFEMSCRDFIESEVAKYPDDFDKEDIVPYLVFKSPEEKELLNTLIENDMVEEHNTSQPNEIESAEALELPENIINILENYPTLDALVASLQTLTTESKLKDVGLAFGYTEPAEFISIMKRDLKAQYAEELHDKIDTLELDTTFADYIATIGGVKPDVALDVMRLDFVRVVQSIVG